MEAEASLAEGYDREVLEEAYDRQHRANISLQRPQKRGHVECSTSSSDTTSSEPFYLPRDYLPLDAFDSDEAKSFTAAVDVGENFTAINTFLLVLKLGVRPYGFCSTESPVC